MKFVKKPVNNRRKNNAHYRDENKAAEQGINGGKHFGGGGLQLINLSHRGKDHRGIKK